MASCMDQTVPSLSGEVTKGVDMNDNNMCTLDEDSNASSEKIMTITKEMEEEEEKLHQHTVEEDQKWRQEKQQSMDQMTEKLKHERYERLQLLLKKSTFYTNYLIDRMKRQKEEEEKQKVKQKKKQQKAEEMKKTEESENKDSQTSTPPKAQRKSGRVLRQQQLDTSQGETKENKGRKRKRESYTPKITDVLSPERKSSKRQKTGKSVEDDEEEEEEVIEVEEDPLHLSGGGHDSNSERVVPDKDDSEISTQSSQTSDSGPTPHLKPVKKPEKGVRLFNGEPVPEEQPILFTGGILRSYQIEGYRWLCSLFENGINGILADEMGLGKTIQCIALVSHLVNLGVPGPFLICVPLSTVPNWVAEFQKFAPRIPVLLYHGTKEARSLLCRKICKPRLVKKGVQTAPVVITSYEVAINDCKRIGLFDWRLMIVDEGHRIKNFQCKLISSLKTYKCSHRLLLTGTPLQNNLAELWSLLNFLLPEIFDDLGSFEMWFDLDYLQSGSSVDDEIIAEEKQHNILAMLHQILTPFMLRRLKRDVDLDVPPKREVLVYAPLSSKQKDLYLASLDLTIRALVGLEKKDEPLQMNEKGRTVRRSRKSINYSLMTKDDSENDDDDAVEKWAEDLVKQQLNTFTISQSKKPRPGEELSAQFNIKLGSRMAILRNVCNHPYLVEYPLVCPGGDFRIDEELVTSSGKLRMLDRILKELKNRGHKVLIFSQMTTLLDIIGDYCTMRGFDWCRLDGSTKLEDRKEEMLRFAKDPEAFVFLLSTRAGGLGLNLTAADTVIIFDSDWNPQCDLQAQDRCHRIGQTKPVLVFRLITANTIDQKIVEKAAMKRKLEKMVIHREKFKVGMDHKRFDIDHLEELNPNELKKLLEERDHDNVVRTEDVEVISDADLKKLLDRSDLVEKWKASKAGSSKTSKRAKASSAKTTSEVSGVFKVIHEDLGGNTRDAEDEGGLSSVGKGGKIDISNEKTK